MAIGFPLPKSLRRAANRAHKAKILARPPLVLEPEHVLYKLADPAYVVAETRIVNGVAVGLSDYYERCRRACVLRAWCAVRLGWRKYARENLELARLYRRDARSAHARGR